MILMYHKIHPDSPTLWWVTVDAFYRQLLELQAKKVVYLDDYDPSNPDHVVITFDGVYQNVLTFAAPLLKKLNYPFELFLASDHVGQDNAFDRVDKRTGQPTNEPITHFASKNELTQLIKMGGRLQWHSRSHPNLNHIQDQKDIELELTVLPSLRKLDPKGFNWFAYPHGEFNDQVITATKKRFKGGLSVIQGNDHDLYQLNRVTVTNQSSFAKASIGVVIPCYNYGSYLAEAIESILKQTRPADKILIINDGSSDNTQEIAHSYVHLYPQLISYISQPTNQGIIKTFNKAVKAIDTDYICLLGADNRFRSDYLEKTAAILDTNNDVAIAYTDFALFGPLASTMYQMIQPERRKVIIEETLYVVAFPEFTNHTVANLHESNFMHGSSLYRKKVWQKVGGYKSEKNLAEDHNLFYRIVKAGWKAKRASEPLLEYRQHSRGQVNTQLNSYAELKFYKNRTKHLQAQLDNIHQSKFWKLLNVYKNPKTALKHYLGKVISKVANYTARLG